MLDPVSAVIPLEVAMRSTLKSRREFENVYSRGIKQVGAAVVLFWLKDAPASDAKVAYVASKKVGGAVERNRARRLMRAAFQELEKTKKEVPKGWLVLVARKAILEMKSYQVAEQLRQLLKRMDPPGVADSPTDLSSGDG